MQTSARGARLKTENFDCPGGKLCYEDPKYRLNDKDYFLKMWKNKFNYNQKEKKQNILDFVTGKTKSVY